MRSVHLALGLLFAPALFCCEEGTRGRPDDVYLLDAGAEDTGTAPEVGLDAGVKQDAGDPADVVDANGDANTDTDADAGADRDSGAGQDADRDAHTAEGGADASEDVRDGEPTDSDRDATGSSDAQSSAEDAAMPIDGGRAFWANTESPRFVSALPGETVSVVGQVWIDGATSLPGGTAGVTGQLGYGPTGTSPSSSAWTFVEAAFERDVQNNDQFVASFEAPPSGIFDYAFRFQSADLPAWREWLIADRSDDGRLGTNDGYQSEHAGKLAVRSVGDAIRVATINLHCLNNDPVARLSTIAQRFATTGADVVALQEVCEDVSVFSSRHSAGYLADRLTQLTGQTWRSWFVETHKAQNVTPEGLGMVSRLPVADTVVEPLLAADFPRKALLVVFASPIGMVGVVSMHLSFRVQDGPARLTQAQQIVGLLDRWQAFDLDLVVAAGDLNATPNEPPRGAFLQAEFVDAFLEVHPNQNGYTYPAGGAQRRIDYIFARDRSNRPIEVSAADVEFAAPYATGRFVSDHLGVSALLQAR